MAEITHRRGWECLYVPVKGRRPSRNFHRDSHWFEVTISGAPLVPTPLHLVNPCNDPSEGADFWECVPEMLGLSPVSRSRERKPQHEMFGLSVPNVLLPLVDVIEKSRRILALEHDWDGEGSVAYDPETWERATKFLLAHAIAFYMAGRGIIQSPSIGNAQEGSIDLYWKTPDRRLLINFPASKESPVTFFGETARGSTVEGNLDLSSADWLFMWYAGGMWQTK